MLFACLASRKGICGSELSVRSTFVMYLIQDKELNNRKTIVQKIAVDCCTSRKDGVMEVNFLGKTTVILVKV